MQLPCSRWNSHVRKTGRKGQVPLAHTGKRRVRGKSWEEFRQEIEGLKNEANDKVLTVERVVLTSPVRYFYIRTTQGTTATRGLAGDHLHTLVIGRPR